MKTVFGSNQEVCHVWASQSQECGEAGHISFKGPVLYSYSAQIARIVDNVVLLTTRKWSVTTSAHQSLAWSAVSHMKKFHVYSVEPDHEKNLEHYTDEIKDCFQKYFRARERKVYLHKSNHELLAKLIEYCKYFEIDCPDVSEHILKLDEEGAKAQKIAYDIAVKAKRDQAKADRKAAQKEIEKAENDWIAGKSNKTFVLVHHKSLEFSCTRLRPFGNRIQTSRNASAPRKDCRILYKAIKAGKPVHGFKLGSYTVTGLNGELVIGCHRITRKEIDRLALSLGW